MTVRLSEVGEYSQRAITRPRATEVSTQVVPARPAREALKRRFGGLAITETDSDERGQSGSLGELVQVVT